MALKDILPPGVKKKLHGVKRTASNARKMLVKRLTRPNLYNLKSKERVGVVFTAPSDMRIDERLFLYAFVRGFQPERALEIGVLAGGGGAIMANAMEENGKGVVIGVDPDPQLRVTPDQLHGRYKVLSQPSPQGLNQAQDMAGGLFDFALIDGLHRYDQVRLDIAGTLPHMADGAYILFHDAFHYGVAQAIKEAIEGEPRLIDCGYPCRTARMDNDELTPYNGFRLLRFSGAKVVESYDTVKPLYQAIGKAAPHPAPDMLNHDGWYCRAIEPCARCVSTGKYPRKTEAV